MKILIEIIPHEKQRYPTCGDWYYEGPVLYIKISKLGDWRKEMLVAVHELHEALLCRARSITEKEVTNFDLLVANTDYDGEPGDLPESPYRKEHFFATTLERLFAAELEVDWKEYETQIENLFKTKT